MATVNVFSLLTVVSVTGSLLVSAGRVGHKYNEFHISTEDDAFSSDHFATHWPKALLFYPRSQSDWDSGVLGIGKFTDEARNTVGATYDCMKQHPWCPEDDTTYSFYESGKLIETSKEHFLKYSQIKEIFDRFENA